MYDHILLRYGEIGLKGKNQMRFIKKLVKDLKFKIKREGLERAEIQYEKGRIFIRLKEGQGPEAFEPILKKMFGIVSYSPVIKAGTDFEEIAETIRREVGQMLAPSSSSASAAAGLSPAAKSSSTTSSSSSSGVRPSSGRYRTFKVNTKRADKTYPILSPEMNARLGGVVLDAYPQLDVDIHQPDMEISVEIRPDFSYIYTRTEKGLGGMPVNSAGRGLLLLSGGIDSPVAGYLAARKGIDVSAIHFYSYPYTSERARDKVLELARQLAVYKGNFVIHLVPFTRIQEEIAKNCEESYWITIMRRFMFRIAERIAADNDALALITGESVGQVASQTLDSMAVINQVIQIPVIRPVATMDKEEIIVIAKEIGTFGTSIEPYEDCCTAFLPREPKTKPQVFIAEEEEEKLEIEALVDQAVAETEVLRITGPGPGQRDVAEDAESDDDLGLF